MVGRGGMLTCPSAVKSDPCMVIVVSPDGGQSDVVRTGDESTQPVTKTEIQTCLCH